jgi:ribonucleoside-diphosphate reductase alpha chain
MGGAERYPSWFSCLDGFRKGLNPSYELTRSRADNLVIMRSAEAATEARGQNNVTAIASRGPTARSSDTIEGAAALKQEASTTCRRPKNRKPCSTTRAVTPSKAERRPEARAKGYEGLAASAGTSLW